MRRISPIKRVTRKSHVLVVPKTQNKTKPKKKQQKNVQRKWAARAKVFLLLFACLLDILILVFAWLNYKYIKKELPF